MQSEYSNLLLKIMPMTKSGGEACPPGRPPRHVKRRLIKSISDAFASHIHFEEESLTVPSSVAKCTPVTEICQVVSLIMVSVKFSSVIHLTVDDYYLCGFGFISISV